MSDQINALLEAVEADVIRWRRYFHQYPELSFQERKTAQYVYETLQSFGHLEISRPTETSVVARLIGRQPGKVLALRADMDALPIAEENPFPFASQNPGVMHACGHDGHTAMLLGAAKILVQLKDRLKGEVRFIFQHAEEQHPGGAQELVKAGVIEGVDEIIGIHLQSLIPVGKIVISTGPVTANSDRFDITIQGKGGHASQPHETIDPIVVGSQVVTNLQQIVSRGCDPFAQLVVSVTQFHGGSAYNVIPDTVTLKGSVRSLSAEVREHARQSIEQIVQGVAAAHRATYTFDYRMGYSSVVNHPEVTEKLRQIAGEVFGQSALHTMPPSMGGEDFSAFSQKVPACYVWLGAGNQAKGIVYPHHHPRFNIDEDSLIMGVKLFVHAAVGLS
ncbi:M20 family metallopeptidase [Brevibacillus marinus]|uniref:M20 family metallopeptidase n=1 Tax=Brevibacillus marinus TaxID=2496837 RepID=UPI002407EF35|nr:M20 family metallopeptidase [Brevibacillus marinus]